MVDNTLHCSTTFQINIKIWHFDLVFRRNNIGIRKFHFWWRPFWKSLWKTTFAMEIQSETCQVLKSMEKRLYKSWFWRIMGGCRRSYFTCPTIRVHRHYRCVANPSCPVGPQNYDCKIVAESGKILEIYDVTHRTTSHLGVTKVSSVTNAPSANCYTWWNSTYVSCYVFCTLLIKRFHRLYVDFVSFPQAICVLHYMPSSVAKTAGIKILMFNGSTQWWTP